MMQLASDAVFVDGEAIADWMGSKVEDQKVAEMVKRAKGAMRSREKGRRGGKRGEVNVSWQGGVVKHSRSRRSKSVRGGEAERQADEIMQREERRKRKGGLSCTRVACFLGAFLKGLNTSSGF
jgi:hypothetical protein